MKINLANLIFIDKPTLVAECGEFKAVGFRYSTGKAFAIHVETGLF